MADKTQPGMNEDTAIKMLRSRPPAEQKSILARLDPGMKAKVLAKLTAAATPNPGPDPALGAEIAGNTQERTKQARQSKVDNLIDTLPTAVGTGASVLGGGKELPTGLLAAGVGGVLGEDMREMIGKHAYTDPARKAAVTNMTPEDVVEKLGEAGGEQAGAELLSRGAGGVFNKTIEKLGLKPAAESVAKAAAGKGVQQTGGEAGGSAALKSLEEYVPHLPGAMQPMKEFEEKRATQTATELARQLDEISARKLSPEQTGQEVRRVVQDMRSQSDAAAQRIYNPVREKLGLSNTAQYPEILAAAKKAAKPAVKDLYDKEVVQAAKDIYNPMKGSLGLPENATRDEMKTAAQKMAQPHAGKLLGPDGKALMQPGDGGAALKKLYDADMRYQKLINTPGDGGAALKELTQLKAQYGAVGTGLDKNLVKALTATGKPEALTAYIQGASLADVRALTAALPKETMAAVNRNLVEDIFQRALDPETKEFDAHKILTGLQDLGPNGKQLLGPHFNTVKASAEEIAKIQHSLMLGGMRGAMHAYGVPAAIGAAVLGALSGHPEGSIAALGAGMGGARALAWLMTNRETALKTLTVLRKITQGAIRVGIPAGIDLYSGSNQPAVSDPKLLQQTDPLAAMVAGGGRR